MTATQTTKTRKRFDVRVWFNDGSRITCCNIVPCIDRTWQGHDAKAQAEATAGEHRYRDRGGIRAVAIVREHETPNTRPVGSCAISAR